MSTGKTKKTSKLINLGKHARNKINKIAMNRAVGSEVFTTLAAMLVPSSFAPDRSSARTKARRYKALFGVSAATCSRLWALVKPSSPSSAGSRHLLWTLYFLKQYSHEEVNAAFCQCDEKTFRKWSWMVMQVLADLELVSESVSVCACFAAYLTTCLCRIFDFIFIFYFTCCCRLSGRTGMKATMGANVWYQ
jgi:hypothetical protein